MGVMPTGGFPMCGRELESIVDYGRHSPAADPVFRAEEEEYWSSTSLIQNPFRAWTVGFIRGESNTAFKDLPRFVRAVRGGF